MAEVLQVAVDAWKRLWEQGKAQQTTNNSKSKNQNQKNQTTNCQRKLLEEVSEKP
jgi:hypothetical protein